MQNQLQRYDQHDHEIYLSKTSQRPQCQFHRLVQHSLLNQQEKFAEICATLGSEDQQTVSLLKITLAAYFAWPVMMPYNSFLESV